MHQYINLKKFVSLLNIYELEMYEQKCVKNLSDLCFKCTVTPIIKKSQLLFRYVKLYKNYIFILVTCKFSA